MREEVFFRGNSLTKTVLQIVGASGILLSALVAPNVLRLFRNFGQSGWHSIEHQERQRIHKALERLRKKRIVKFVQKGDDTFIQVVEKGKSHLRQFQFSRLSLPKAERWDHVWRLAIFDVPEHKKRQRDIFSDKLKKLGFFPLQKSVFAFPYPCQDEVDFTASFLGIEPYVLCLETGALGRAEGPARRRFGLL